MRRPQTLRTSLLWRFMVVSVTPIVVVGFLAMAYLTQSIRENAETANKLLAQSLASEIEIELQKALLNLEQIAGFLEDIPNETYSNEMLDRAVRRSPFFESVYMVDTEGKVCHVGLLEQQTERRADYLGLDLSHQAMFRDVATSGRPVWSDAFFSVITGKLSLSISVPFKESTLAATFSIERLYEMTAKSRVGSSPGAMVLDKQGIVLFHPDAGVGRQKISLRDLDPVMEGIKGNFGSYHYVKDEVPYLGSVAQVPETGWLVLVSQPAEAAYRPVHNVRIFGLVGTLGGAFAALFIALHFSRRLSRPLSQLSRASHAVAAGQYDLQIASQTYAEVDEVATSLRSMANAIQDRETTLQSLTKSMVGVSGQECFDRICRELCAYLKCEIAVVGRLTEGLQVEAVAMTVDGEPVRGFSYPLSGTPCERIYRDEFCIFPENVATLFPNDGDLARLGIQGYVGVSLRDRDGSPIGILNAMSYTPLRLPEHAREILDIMAARAATELERERTEQALREREAQYRALVENSPDVIARYDLEGRHIFVSESATQLTGIPAEEYIGKTPRETGLGRRQTAAWEACLQRCVVSRAPAEVELEMEFPDGRHILSTLLFPERDAEGGVRSVFGMYRDITEHRTAEREYRLLFEQMQEGFALHEIVCDAEGVPVDYRYLSVNPAFERLTGVHAESAVGHTVRDIMPGTENSWIERFGQVALTGEPASFEEYASEIGKYFEVVAFSPRKMQFACIFRDVTDRRRAEEEIRNLATAVQQAAELIMITGPDGRVEYVNPAFEKTMGTARGEVVGKNVSRLVAPDEIEAGFPELLDALAGSNAWIGRMGFLRNDGTVLKLEASVSPIRERNGKVLHYVAVGRDVTLEIELEKRVRQTQKMEAIGTLAGGIAHDFNNILNAITGYTELAMQELPEDSSTYDCLKEVSSAANRAADLVRQILTFSRQQEQARQPIRLQPIIKETIRLLRRSIPSTAEIIVDIHDECGPIVADPTEVHQILMNLCTNACQAMHGDPGSLRISLIPVKLDEGSVAGLPALTAGPYVQLAVSDTGTGMDEVTLARIFEPYFTTKAPGEGTGLGLAIVHGIVTSYGGEISVESRLGQGTTFTIWLPESCSFVSSSEKKEKAVIPAGNGERVMIVDDEAPNVRVMRVTLRRLGYDATGFTSSEEALAAFCQNPGHFDLVITDQTMPKLTGINLAERLLKVRPDIPIILCTGYSETVSGDEAKSTGIRAFLMKPLQPTQLAEAIQRIFTTA